MERLKQCLFCAKKYPLVYFTRNSGSPDGLCGWCRKCESEAKRRQKYNIPSHVVSFSGGKDSTAMLHGMIDRKMPIDAVIYFDCGSWEFPQMEKHIQKVEKNTGISIMKIVPPQSFEYLMFEKVNPSKKMQGNGWPTPALRWCTMIKQNIIKRYLRQFRPYYMYIGFAFDENERVDKAQKYDGGKWKANKYPLVEWQMTEKMAIDYCRSLGYNWDGLYDYFDRVSCWCCPLQKLEDLRILCKNFPELWGKMKEWNQRCWNDFKNDPDIIARIESETINQ